MSLYPVILADPPWPFDWQGGVGGRRRNRTLAEYRPLSLEEILAFPVPRADAAHLYLWITPQLNRRAVGIAVASAWGFEVVDELIWEKPNLGVGVFPRHCHEPLLICRRGGLRFEGPRNVRSVQRWRQHYSKNGGKRHSAKPDELYTLIELASPYEPKLELFARRRRRGWDAIGDQLEEVAVER